MIIQRIILFIMLSAAFLQGSYGQVINTAVSSQSVCPGTITVPVVVSDCNGVAGISLALHINPAVLNYASYQNLHPQLNGGLLVINQSQSKLFFSWASTTVANVGNDTLVELVFNTVPGTSTLNWDVQTPGNCEYSDFNGLALASTYTNATATIYAPPLINTQPSHTSPILGNNAVFSVSASGTGLTYQWQKSEDEGLNWENVSGPGFANPTTNTLTVSSVSFDQDGFWFRVLVSGTCPDALYSDIVELSVLPTPQHITVSTGSLSGCPGTYIVPVLVEDFTSVNGLSLTLNYPGQLLTFTGSQNIHTGLSGGLTAINATATKIFISWASQTAASLSSTQDTLLELVFEAPGGGSGSLSWDTQISGNCEITRTDGSAINASFVNTNVSLHYVPVINTQPLPLTIISGQGMSFSVNASGTGLSYQWQVSENNGQDWADILPQTGYSGQNGASLSRTSTPIAYNGYLFRLIIEGTCQPAVISDAVLLTVNPPPQEILVQSGSYTGCAGTIIIPVMVTNFVDVGSVSLGLSFNSGLMDFIGLQNPHAALSNGLVVGNAVGNQVYISWAATDPVTLSSGQEVLVDMVFSGNLGGSGSFSWNTSTLGVCEITNSLGQSIITHYTNGTLNLQQPPAITVQPQNSTFQVGQNGSFSLSASGVGLSYQWQVSTDGGQNWTNASSVSASIGLGSISMSMDGYRYRCIVNGTCEPEVLSNEVELTVIPAIQVITLSMPTISDICTEYMPVPVNVTNFTGVGSFSLTVNYNPALLTFTGLSDVSPELSSGLIISNASNGKVYITWASTIAANVGNGVMFHIEFLSIGGTSSLVWDTQTSGNCEIANLNGNSINTLYTNGSIAVAALPLSVSAGDDIVMIPGTPVTLNASVTGGNLPYTISWTPASSLSDASIVQPTANPQETTLYTLEVTDNTGCTGSDEAWVIVQNIPVVGWAWALGEGSTSAEEAYAVSADNSGNVISSGYFSGSSLQLDTNNLINPGNGSMFLTKHNPSGDLLWALASQSEGWAEGKALACDDDGNIYLSGSFQNTTLQIQGQSVSGFGWSDVFLAKFSPLGNLLWLKSFGGTSQDKAADVAVDSDGNVYIAGYFLSPNISFGSTNLVNTATNFADIFLAKLDTDGILVWAKKAGGNQWDEPYQMAVSPVGEVYLTGYFVSPGLQFPGQNLSHLGTGNPNAFLAKFNTQGNAVWTKRPDVSQYNYGTGLGLDSLGNIYWTGYFQDASLGLGSNTYSNSGGSDIFLAKLNSAGVYQWSRKPEGAGFDKSKGVLVRSNTEIWLYGNTNSTQLIFDNLSVGNAGFYDFFLTAYNDFGSVMLSQSVGGTNEDLVHSGAVDFLGNIFVVGSYKSQSLVFGNWMLANANTGVSDIFLAKYGATDAPLQIGAEVIDITCFGDGNGMAQVMVYQGMPPFSYAWNTGASTTGIQDLEAGSYTATVTDVNGISESVTVVVSEPDLLQTLGIAIDPTCSSCTDGSISLVVEGGTEPYSYLWNNGETTESLVGLEVGLYTVVIADARGCESMEEFELTSTGTVPDTQLIQLNSGWSYISTYIDPLQADISMVCSPIVGELFIVKDEGGNTYWPSWSINTINSLIIGKAYQFRMLSTRELEITGFAVQPELTPLTLPMGWSFLAYLRQTEASIMDILQPINQDIRMVKNSSGNTYWPAYGINGIGNMIPGQGYHIQMLAQQTYTYPANDMPISKSCIQNLFPKYFNTTINTGSYMTLGVISNRFQTGCEIAVFSKRGFLVGSAVVHKEFTAVNIWGLDALDAESNGLEPGDEFSLKLWNVEDGLEYDLIVNEWIEGNNIYENNKVSIAGDFQIVKPLTGVQLFPIHPNPFQFEAYVSYYLPYSSNVKILVYNSIGELVQFMSFPCQYEGKYTSGLLMENLKSGVYYLNFQTEEESITRKIIKVH